jgi:hypothetical protein
MASTLPLAAGSVGLEAGMVPCVSSWRTASRGFHCQPRDGKSVSAEITPTAGSRSEEQVAWPAEPQGNKARRVFPPCRPPGHSSPRNSAAMEHVSAFTSCGHAAALTFAAMCH